ncbi:MAG: lipopolysaccharide heptosyltransferase II [Planctomycetales bacterium]|nr:lipopolysaccharide heptosyltransferase II [Planctomycetales bacterium]
MKRLVDNLDHVEAKRICVIKPSALGDVIQATVVLDALRSRFPDASISWVIKDSLAPLLSHHSQIDEVIPFRTQQGWRMVIPLFRQLRRAKFDLTLDLQGLFRTAVMTFATGAPHRVGLQTAREGASLTYNCLVNNTGWDQSAVGRLWQVAAALGDHSRKPPEFPAAGLDLTWARQQLASLSGPLLAISPGTRWTSKQWPAERFAEIARDTVARFGGSVVILGADNECELSEVIERAVRQTGGNALNLTGATGIPQLGAVLAMSHCLLSNDSGAMHLAAAVGTPFVSVFTSTSPQISGPIGAEGRMIAASTSCAGCYQRRCPLVSSQPPCFGQVDSRLVTAAVGEYLQRAPNTASRRAS